MSIVPRGPVTVALVAPVRLMFLTGLLIGAPLQALAADIAPDCLYPPAEHRLGIEGVVILDVTVGVDGTVKDAAIVNSSGNAELDRVAATCAKATWHYKPAKKDGVPIEAHTKARVVWKLH